MIFLDQGFKKLEHYK